MKNIPSTVVFFISILGNGLSAADPSPTTLSVERLSQKAESEAVGTLKPGDSVDCAVLADGRPIRGDIPKSWDPDKLYLLECWATWCGPCIQAMPHVNQLHTKLQHKGVHVIGLNVWDDFVKATAFMKSKGDAMAYPVAFMPKGGAFDKRVLQPAGVNGIPSTLAIRNGKLLFVTFPDLLDDAKMEALIAGGAREAKAVAELVAAAGAQAADTKAQNAEIDARIERLGDIEKKVSEKIADKDLSGAMQILDEAAKKKAATRDDQIYLINTKIMIFLALKEKAKALDTLDAAARAYPDSPMAKNIDDFRKMIQAAGEE